MHLSTMPKTTTRHLDSVVHGYHVYMDRWDRVVGDKFNAEIEENNPCDQYAVVVKVKRDIFSMESSGKNALQSLLGQLIVNQLFDDPGVEIRGI